MSWRFVVLLCSAGLCSAWELVSAEERFPRGSVLEGLPNPDAEARIYSADPRSPLNELQRLLFTETLVPVEVGAVLPEERARTPVSDAEFFTKGWYFRKRPGGPEERRLFGGDVRISPVQKPDAEKSAQLISLLDRLSTPEKVDEFAELRAPLARLLVQWDLLSLWWRWEQLPENDPALQSAMARGIRALSQPRNVLTGLSSGASELRQAFAGGNVVDPQQPYLPEGLLGDSGEFRWTEIDRRSTKLFHAGNQMRAARVFLDLPADDLQRFAAGDAGALESWRTGSRPAQTALVLTLMGVDTDGRFVATPVIDELRIRVSLTDVDEEARNRSSSRDGSNHWIYFRSRRQSVVDREAGPFRFIPDSSQSLFLEYGTAKHTTYVGQCSLCHRLTNSGDQAPFAIRSLSKQAGGRVAQSSERRFRLAEQELQPAERRLQELTSGPGPAN